MFERTEREDRPARGAGSTTGVALSLEQVHIRLECLRSPSKC